MRIRLERKLNTCSHKLACTVCCRSFEPNKIRALLYNDKGLIQGDLCSACLTLKSPEIRKKMREQASLLMQQPASRYVQSTPCHDRAIELLEASQESVEFPSALQWWLKKMEILLEVSQDPEAVRLGRVLNPLDPP